MSFCKEMRSSLELMMEYNKISSAYNLILEETRQGISLTKHKNNRGAKTVPWGTPEVTVEELLEIPSVITF